VDGTHPNYTGITKNFKQEWTLDKLGNWQEFKTDVEGNGYAAAAVQGPPSAVGRGLLIPCDP